VTAASVAVAGVLARLERRLLRSVEPGSAGRGSERTAQDARPVVAVVGLRSGSGATTIARALARELAARDPAGAAAVCGRARSGAGTLRSPSAARLARTLSRVAPAGTRAVGRLCLVETEHLLALTAATMDVAPLVLDAASGAHAANAVSLADHTLLVVSSAVEPALAAVVAASLACAGPQPVCVVNRVRDPGRWHGRSAVLLPETRLGARLAGAGHGTRGAFGPGLRDLADRCGMFPCE